MTRSLRESGLGADLLDHRSQLVDVCFLPSGALAGPATPLAPVHRAQVSALVRPFVPDSDPILLQVPDVRVTRDEPQQLVDDRLEVDSLGREQREVIPEVDPDLLAEQAGGSGSGAVALGGAVREHSL